MKFPRWLRGAGLKQVKLISRKRPGLITIIRLCLREVSGCSSGVHSFVFHPNRNIPADNAVKNKFEVPLGCAEAVWGPETEKPEHLGGVINTGWFPAGQWAPSFSLGARVHSFLRSFPFR